ncbi:hypothetical protein E3N88_13684 [Mikania micrantha]|uniref:Uncharacterized protein n=1 Tax=Mikania micrantha TaxID=192012 RepID=A0A5N6NZA2_9ASTR|nr:hypothetical protein E3N88_13684 [Mikania micrantha]
MDLGRASTAEATASTAEATPETTDDDDNKRKQEPPQGSTTSRQIVPFKIRGPFRRRHTAARRRSDEPALNTYFPIVEWSYLSTEKPCRQPGFDELDEDEGGDWFRGLRTCVFKPPWPNPTL